MPEGAGDSELHHHIVETLIGEYARGTSGVSVPVEKARVFAAAWGLYAQIHRYARAALLLMNADMAQEAHALVRIVLEFTVVLHWLVETGEDGVRTLERKQAEHTKKFLNRAQGAKMQLPSAAVSEFEELAVLLGDAEAAMTFEETCRRMGILDLYAVYCMESAFVHPSLLVINTYLDPGGGPALSVRPHAKIHDGNVPLLALCLLWANRDLDDLTTEHPARDGLERLAASIGVPPRLPQYGLPPASVKRRSRRRKRKRTRGSRSQTESDCPTVAAEVTET